MNCPLCLQANSCKHFFRDRQRDYYRCEQCNLIHVPPSQHLSVVEEQQEYDKHQNSAKDPGYRQFLNRLFQPLNTKLAPNSKGLDFGSGPGPTLSVMFAEAGHDMRIYDPIYAPDKHVMSTPYGFITASEVFEHLRQPARELEQLWSILKPGGWLGTMTKLALDKEAFANWHYKNDMTHICFFSVETMEWLANHWQASFELVGKDVVIFQKTSG